jgi:hypothetical protein
MSMLSSTSEIVSTTKLPPRLAERSAGVDVVSMFDTTCASVRVSKLARVSTTMLPSRRDVMSTFSTGMP